MFFHQGLFLGQTFAGNKIITYICTKKNNIANAYNFYSLRIPISVLCERS